MDVTISKTDTSVVVTVTDGIVVGQSNSFDVVEYAPFLGLVGHWKFDDGSGTTAVDSSSQANDGSVVNTPTWTTGISNGALIFNGTTQYASITDAGSLDFGIDDFTIAAWIKMGTTANAVYTIYSKGIGETANRGQVWLYVDNTDKIALQIEGTTGGQTATYTSTTTINDTNWHHVAVSADRDGNGRVCDRRGQCRVCFYH